METVIFDTLPDDLTISVPWSETPRRVLPWDLNSILPSEVTAAWRSWSLIERSLIYQAVFNQAEPSLRVTPTTDPIGWDNLWSNLLEIDLIERSEGNV